MGNEVYIASDDNQINLVNTDRQIVITQPNCNTSINVNQPVTSVVEILTGPPGPAGVDGRNAFPFTGSAIISGSLIVTGSTFTSLTASAGLFSGSGAELFNIPASAVVGLALNQITTGSVSASVNLGTNAFTVKSGSITFLNISNQGVTTITGSLTVSGSSTFTNIGPAIFSGSITQNASTASFGGRVGIGTTTPSSPLHIKNSVATYLGGLILEKSDASLTYNLYVDGSNSFAVSKGASQFFTVDQSGNAGIGISTPTAKLQVKGSGATSSTTALLVQNSDNTFNFSIKDNGDLTSNNNFVTINSYDATINGANKVAINGTNFGTGYIYRGVSSGFLILGNDSTVSTGITLYGSTHATLRDSIRINQSGSTVVTIVSGSVGIGTTTPAYRLDVSGSGNFTNNLTVTGSIITNSALTASSALINGNVVIRGTASVDVLITNYESSSIIYASGSTKFGDTLDDTHEFTGSLFVTGSTVSLQGGSFSGSGANLFNIPASGITGLNLSQIATGSISASVSLGTGSFTITSGSRNFLFISSSGNIGIGTTTPTNAVHIRTAAGGATSNYALVWQESTGDRVLGYLGADNTAFFSGALYLYQNGVSNTKITANGASYLMGGNVLIGTATDSGFKLDVNGTGRFSNNVQITGSATNSLLVKGSGTTSSTTALLVQNSNASSSLAVLDNGRVGIGTTTPAYQLSVVAPNANDGIVAYVGSSGMIITGNAGFGNPGITSTSGTIHVAATLNGTGGSEVLNVNKSTNGAYIQAWRSQASSILTLVAGDGSIGIKTPSPSASLHVVGNTILSGSAGTGSALLVYKSGSTVVDIQGSQGQLFSVVDALSGSLMSVNDVSGLPILEVFSDDRVVMGTYGAPGLTVTGSVTIASGSFSGSFFGNGSGLTNISASAIVGLNLSQIATGSISASVSTGTGSFTVSSGSTSFLYVSNSGSVGIGTTNPGATLDARGTIFRFGNGVSSNIEVVSDGTTSGLQSYNNTNGILIRTLGTQPIKFATNTSTTVLTITGSSVGIGTTAPVYMLDVTGSARISGTTYIGNDGAGSAALYTAGNVLAVAGNNNHDVQMPGMYVLRSGAGYGVGIQATTYPALDSSAILTLTSTTRGFLLPRTNLTSNISSPARGLMTYVTASATEGIWYYNSGSYQGWTRVLNDTGSQSISGSFTVVGTSNLGGATFSSGGGTFTNNVNLGAINEGTGNSWINFNTTRVHIGQNGSSAGLNVVSATQYVAIGKNTANTTLDVLGDVLITGSLNITNALTASSAIINGNLTVIGTASFAYTTASIVNIGAATITLNTDNPAVRYGGINVVDSGSYGTSSTGSLLWDSQNNKWIYSNPSGSTYDGGMLISGPRNTSGLGNEEGTTLNALMKGQGGDHITSSGVFEVSGSVGIGTSTPSASLHITGSSSAALLEIDSPAVNNILFVTGSGRVGIGTNAPAYTLDVSGSGRFTNGLTNTGSFAQSGSSTFYGGNYLFKGSTSGDNGIQIGTTINGYTGIDWTSNNVGFGLIAGGGITTKVNAGIGFNVGTAGTTSLGAMLGVKGSGTTSSTTAFLVQNANASASFTVKDDGYIRPYYGINFGSDSPSTGNGGLISPYGNGLAIQAYGASSGNNRYGRIEVGNVTATSNFLGYFVGTTIGTNSTVFGATSDGSNASTWFYFGNNLSNIVSSAIVNIDSTDRGLLIPRTHATSNISTPARGLMTYVTASATEGLYLYNSGSTPGWQKVITDAVTGSMTVVSASYALTASYVNPLNQNVLVTGSVYVSQSIYGGDKTLLGSNVNNGYLAFTQNGSNEIQSSQYLYITRIGNNGFLQIRSWSFVDIDSSLGVGLNSQTPSARLHVKGSGATSSTTALLVENSGATASLAVLDNGNVGIGTSSPGNKLEVVGATDTKIANFTANLPGGGNYFTVGLGNGGMTYIAAPATTFGRQIRFAPYATTVLTIQSALDATLDAVGIGTTTPAYKLDVSGSGNFTSNLTVTGSLTVSGSSTFTNIGPAIFSGSITQTASTASFGGLVGIGTNSPTFALEVSGSGGNQGVIRSRRLIAYGGTAGDPPITTTSTIAGLFEAGYAELGFSSYGGEAGRIETNARLWNIGMTGGTAKMNIRGTGATSSTTALLVQNSGGNRGLEVRDDLTILTGNSLQLDSGNGNRIFTAGQLTLQSNNTTQAIKLDGVPYLMSNNSTFVSVAGANSLYTQTAGSMTLFGINGRLVLASGSATINSFAIEGSLDAGSSTSNGLTRGLYINQPLVNNTSGYRYYGIQTTSGGAYINTSSPNASAALQADSTTQGFLQPRMTTTQKNAITASATGLQVYDSTINKNSLYNGTNWTNLLVDTGSQSISGSLELTSALTASNAIISGNVTVLGTASINTLIVNQTQLSTGSNQLGDAADDFQTLFGTVRIPTGSLTVTGSTTISGSTILSGSTSFYSTQNNAFVAIVSGSRSSSDIAFNFQKIGETAGSRHTMIVQGTGGNDNNLYFGVNQVGSNPGATFAVKGNGSVNINMPNPAGNYAGLAVGGWISGYPSLLVRGYGSTSSTTALRVENANASASLVVLDNGNVGIGTSSPAYPLHVSGAVYFESKGTSAVTHTLLFKNDNSSYGGLTIGSSGQPLIIQQNTGYGYLSAVGFNIGSTNSTIWTNNGSVLDVKDATGTIPYLRIASTTGNFLIGTTADAGFKLDISGSGRFSSNLTVTGSVIIDGGLFDTTSTGSLATGSTLIYSVNTGSYTAGFFDYYAVSGSNGRAGTVMSFWLGGQVQYTDNSTPDVGNTSNIAFSMSLSASSAQLFASASSAGWNVKTSFRTI